VELMATVPAALKVHGRTKKVLMREAFRDLLPARILDRRKVGFSVPMALWLRTDLRATLDDVLSESEVRRLGYLHWPEVERIKVDHLAGRDNHESRLWALMNLVCWHRQHQQERVA
jgi:asparagine synthase (glutamine-hydrolysing)